MPKLNFQKVREMKLPELLADEDFKSHYVWLYNTCHRSTDGEQHYERETTFLKRMVMDVADIANATTISIMTALLDLAYHGLSIEPVSKAQAYLLPRPHNIGSRENKVWEKRVTLLISAYGELALRVRSGIIKYADNPVMVYDGDPFEVINGVVHHTQRHTSEAITNAYIKITRMDGSVEYKVFSMLEILSFKAKAKEEQQKSLAWTGGVGNQPTRGMIEAKVIRHAFSTYPRLNLGGQNTIFANDDDELVADTAYATVMAKITEGEDNDEMPPEFRPPNPADRHVPAEQPKADPKPKQQSASVTWDF